MQNLFYFDGQFRKKIKWLLSAALTDTNPERAFVNLIKMGEIHICINVNNKFCVQYAMPVHPRTAHEGPEGE